MFACCEQVLRFNNDEKKRIYFTFICVYVHTSAGTLREDPLELELEAVVSYWRGHWDQTQVLWKSIKCS